MNLLFSDAQQKQENQLKALRSFVAQGVDAIAFAPVVETGWEPVLQEIKEAGIPVVLVDRSIAVSDESLYSTFLGPDPTEEGRKAGRFLAEKTGGKAVIAELSGTPGSAPAISRAKGFQEVVQKYPGMSVVLSQTGDFTRAKGKEVMEAFLKTAEAKNLTALYAHNDDMALGAIQAIEEAGRQPGKDIVIVSVDGVRGAFEAMIAGKLNCSVECNPLMGPQLFDAVNDLVAKKSVPKHITTVEGIFDETTAAQALPGRKY